MLDIGEKKEVTRRAVARGEIILRRRTLEAVKRGEVKKGDVLTTAKLSGLRAVKETYHLIPLCHPIPLTYASIDLEVQDDKIVCRTEVRARYRTGVEMEALVGTSVALLTVWDMVKYLEKDDLGQYPETLITRIAVESKEKGE